MHKFKVGDRVERLAGRHRGMEIGDVSTVTKTREDKRSIELCGYGEGHDPHSFALYKPTTLGSNPHEKLIIEWLKGAVVEQSHFGSWVAVEEPHWSARGIFRVKPEIDVVALKAESKTISAELHDINEKCEALGARMGVLFDRQEEIDHLMKEA